MRHAIAFNFCQIKVAEILAGTVAWKGEGERQETDWKTAGEILLAAPFMVDRVVNALTDDDSYTVFEHRFGDIVWHFVQPRRNLPPPYGEITCQ